MNTPGIPMDLDNPTQEAPSSPLSSHLSSDGFSSPVPDDDVDHALSSEDENLATREDDEDDDDAVAHSPPRKRAKGCLSSIAVPASVKAAVAKASGGKCWLCDLYAVHIAHVIAKSDKILVRLPPLPFQHG